MVLALKLALHRSITFWSGILLLAFICWARVHSFERGGYLVAWKGGCGSIAGGVLILWNPDDGSLPFSVSSASPVLAHLSGHSKMPSPFAIRGGHTYAEAGLASPAGDFSSLKMYFQACAPYYRPSFRMWFAPYWCLLPAVGSLWIGLLLWRVRRRTRAAV